jgi:hypothetical protein
MSDKLVFDDLVPRQKMVTGAVAFGCVLLAGLPNNQQVQFVISSEIFADVLRAKSVASDEEARRCCQKNRDRIEAASRKAYAERPSPRVVLKADDFRHIGD